jgi:Xaa-Pro aminopeptidase
MEYEVMAEVLHEFHRHNAQPAYAPIVGGGANACVMHYRNNDQPLKDGELLLLDAGCEHETYASDITRTVPVSGRFAPAQRAVYEVVLEAQLLAIDKVRVGNDWNEPHDAAVRALTLGLHKLGLLKGKPSQLVKDRAYLEFFKHRTGHWLGLDVHDVGDYQIGGQWRQLEAGMALTVEPGIYIRPSAKIPKEFWNIGVRIEDDVLVTAAGPEVLSAGLEKEPDAIERLVQGG